MRTLVVSVLVIAGQFAADTSAFAQQAARQEMRSLDEQVQEVKTDVLTIARDLALLEERLLYPSNTQLSVFVDLSEGASFRLDAVRVEIDGTAVAHHIYSFKELEALQNGGVQRLFTANIPTGTHDLVVAVSGKLPNGDDFTSSESLSISKGVDPKLIGLELEERAGGAAIALQNW